MKNTYIFLILSLFWLSPTYIHADITDSLKNALPKSKASEKFDIYLTIAEKYRGNNTDSAIYYTQLAINFAEKTKNTEKISLATNEMGVVYYLNDQYIKAIEYYQKAYEIDKKLKHSDDIATRLNNIGLAFCALGNYSKAIDHFSEALKIDQQRKDTAKIAIRLNNIGIVYTRFELYPKALDYFISAYRTDSARNNKALCAARLNNIGWVYLKMLKPDESIPFFNKAIVLDKETENTYNLNIRYHNLGKAFVLKKNYNEAIKLFNQVLEFDRTSGNKSDIAAVLTDLAQAYYKTGNTQKAFTCVYESLELAKETKAQDVIIDNYKIIANLFASQNKFKEAFTYSNKYNLLKDSLFSSESKKKLEAFQFYYENQKKENEIIILNRDKQLKVLQLKQREEELYNQRLSNYWFFAIAIIVLLIVAFLYLYSMNSAIKNRHRLEKSLNLYMQKALSQQMNPHFIFNTLNSIQFFLLNNDKIASSKYLSKFARLMRLTLDNSQKPQIPLTDEIESLKLYIELEQLRFENKFSYDLQFDSVPEDDTITLPPLILQPFIENAIWHGLMHRENPDGGKLQINFKYYNNILSCIIEDNGIGREKAKEIRLQKKPEHVSWGTKITESRIALINELHKSKLHIKYTDLFNENHEPSGTRVEIEIPV